MSVPDSSNWNFGTNDFSINFWYKKVGSQSSYPAVLEHWSISSSSHLWWIVDYCQYYQQYGLTFSGGGAFAPTPNNVSSVCNGNWHYVVFVGKNQVVASYVDGALISSSTETSPISGDSSAALYIGKDIWYVCYIHAYLDDVRIYNRALSAAEIAAIYNATK